MRGSVPGCMDRFSDKQSDEQLRLLTTIVENSTESVLITNAQLELPGPQIVYVNPAFTKMTGYMPGEVIGKTPRILQGPKTERSVLDRLRKDCAAGKVFHGETINYRKDGSEFYVEWTIAPVWNERGEITHFVANQRDLTDRLQVDDRLRKREEEFRSLFELSAVGMTQVSPEGRYLRVNRKLCAMLGYSEQELLDLTLHQVTHPDDRAASAARLQTSFANGPDEYSIEKRYIRKDGAIIWVSINWTVVRDASGNPLRTVANIQDITRRKLTEEALRKSEALNKSVLRSLAAHIAVLDRDGNIIAVNEAWKRFAYENGNDAIAGSVRVNYLDVCRRSQDYDDDARRALNGIQAVLQGTLPDFVIEYPCHSPDQQRWFLMSVTPLLGERSGAVVTHTNITERKRIEEALQESEERLELAMEAGEIGSFDWNIRTHEILWTEQSKVIFGQPSGAARGTHEDWRRQVNPDDLAGCEASIRDAFIGKHRNWQAEYRVTDSNSGGDRWVNSRGHIFYDSQGKPLRMIGVNMDVTERRQAEDALKKSVQEVHDLYNHAPCGYHSIDKDALFVLINDTELEWLGYSRDEVVGKKHFNDLLTPQGLHSFETNFPEFLALGSIQDLEFDLVRKDGTILPVLLSATAVKDQRGEFLMSRSVVYDMTERKRADEAVRLSESRLRQLADAMPQIVYTCGPDGMADYINRRWYEYSGTSMEQPLAKSWPDVIHPDDRERTRLRWQESVKAGVLFDSEYRLRRKDGQYRWHLSRAIPVRDESSEVVKWIGTSTDIHDRKEAEAEREELLAREQSARAEVEHATESIRRLQAVTDSTLGRFALDALLREMLGRVRELLEADFAAILLLTEDGRSLAVRAAIGAEEETMGFRVPIGEGIAGSIAARRTPLMVEDIAALNVVNPILRQRTHSLIGAPLMVEGRLIGVIHADTILARRFTESDLRLLQLAADRIALAIEQTRLYEVEKLARRQAEESNRMKDEFLALVSHELRSPLNAMLGYVRLLRFGTLDAEKIKKAVDVIERGGRVQTQLIDDLLDTARIISGKLRLEVRLVDLVSVIEEAVHTIYPAASAKGITITTDLNPKVWQITGDAERLQQVVWNLLSNAVKFTPAGGHVETRLERVDPHVCITVRDTGKGISPDFLPYVFDRFRQADASSTRRYGGLGLGLSLVKYLVELHGGTIEALSEGEGKGATFKVLLPVPAVSRSISDLETSFPAVESRKAMLAGVCALVVEDEDDARELIKAVLAQYGADVVVSSSAAEAFALITTTPERPNVIVTDLSMPDEDGYSLLRRVREWEREHGVHIPAIALTAYGRSEDRTRALTAGFQMHVAKPVEPDELAVAIASLMDRNDNRKRRFG
jgi:PAS domain S-box-containing protein